MNFLLSLAVVAAFAAAAPRLFRGCYWILMLPVFTLGPASFLYIGAALAGWDVSFSVCCGVALVTCALPFLWWTDPG